MTRPVLVLASISAALLSTAQPTAPTPPAKPNPPTNSTPLIADVMKKDEKMGAGPKAGKDDVITVLYSLSIKGDKKVIEDNKSRAPLAFVIGGRNMIQGFSDGVIGMQAGGKRTIEIPPAKAYGPRQMGPIPPNSTLVFEIEALRVDHPKDKQKISVKTTKPGAGPSVKSGDKVSIHYVGTYLNAVKFDSSRDRNEPFKFQTGQGAVIPGFDQAMIGMKPGEIRKVTIPYTLAYGETGAGQAVPPFSTLVFELELLSIDK